MRSIQELEAIRESTLENMTLRKEHNGTRIVVGMATCGIAAGARGVLTADTRCAHADGLHRHVPSGADSGGASARA